MYHPKIETLIHVADTGSFSKAADNIYLTAVSVMNQINDLMQRLIGHDKLVVPGSPLSVLALLSCVHVND